MAEDDDTAQGVLRNLTDRLHAHGRLRVWSLVITIFGDAVVPRGGRVALGVLQQIMDRLRIEPGALRTAMSRLARDRWVVRERQGRNSFFSLDPHVQHGFDRATRRIYAAGPPLWEGGWTVALAPGGMDTPDLSDLGFLRVGAGVYLRPETAGAPDASGRLGGMLVIRGTSTDHPELFRALWPLEELAAAYRGFVAAFGPLRFALEDGRQLPPPDAMAARTLMIHDWRRIILRDPGLPGELLPQAWPGDEARVVARAIHAHLLATSEAWLDAAGLPAQVDPAGFSARWTA